jgi:glycosyltransferase involved in cell wall biosynthesis
MLSVVIATKDVERVLVATLGALVAGAAAGIVREVILADGGSQDQTREVGDIAGCHVLVSSDSLSARFNAAVASARGPWLCFLRPGVVLDSNWIEETSRFVETTENAGLSRAAVFRSAPRPGAQRPALLEALSLLRLAAGARPRPDQGLIISKALYQSLGGHAGENPEEALLRRLGRRRLTVLRSAATRVLEMPPDFV